MKKDQPAATSSRLTAMADRHAARIAFALAQLASRVDASDGSDTAMWRIRQCEAIVQANVRRALAEMMPADAGAKTAPSMRRFDRVPIAA